jgi:hypothetical protein
MARIFVSSARRAAALTFFTAIAAAGALAAERFESHYTSAAENDCRTVAQAGPGDGEWHDAVCPGRAGMIVFRAESDLRQAVSVGRTLEAARAEPAAETWFGPFNYAADTIEWRGVAGARQPFAIIQRWFLADSENTARDGSSPEYGMLIVTRLPPGPVCHAAYIDVRANPEANVRARQAADTLARNFRCGADEVVIFGNRGRAIELVRP